MQGLPAAVYTCDVDGRVTLFNDAATALWGRTPELHIDAMVRILEALSSRWLAGALARVSDGVDVERRDGAISGEEVVIERPDGTRRHVIPYPEPLRDASGAVVGAVNMLVDITDRKRAETETIVPEERPAMELAGMTRLHEFSTRLLAETDLQRLLEDVLDAIVTLQNADLGILQLLQPGNADAGDRGASRLCAGLFSSA